MYRLVCRGGESYIVGSLSSPLSRPFDFLIVFVPRRKGGCRSVPYSSSSSPLILLNDNDSLHNYVVALSCWLPIDIVSQSLNQYLENKYFKNENKLYKSNKFLFVLL